MPQQVCSLLLGDLTSRYIPCNKHSMFYLDILLIGHSSRLTKKLPPCCKGKLILQGKVLCIKTQAYFSTFPFTWALFSTHSLKTIYSTSTRYRAFCYSASLLLLQFPDHPEPLFPYLHGAGLDLLRLHDCEEHRLGKGVETKGDVEKSGCLQHRDLVCLVPGQLLCHVNEHLPPDNIYHGKPDGEGPGIFQ